MNQKKKKKSETKVQKDNRKASINIIKIMEQIASKSWFVSTCSNKNDANHILESCPTIENGNFLVRRSEKKPNQYTITLWFDNTSTHVRINQLGNDQYQLELNPNSNLTTSIFSTINDLIEFYTENHMKLTGHCNGFIKLKFNPNLFKHLNS
ncbi:hypothetical protein I4U23_030581 [Adineta vaga]|nr:hypothetical protein I4U23_030581 [Adineta vaga]